MVTWHICNGLGCPCSLLHTMRNMDCTKPLKMLTVFNNVDAGELTMLDKILGFPMDVVLASTGLDKVCTSCAPSFSILNCYL